MIVLSLVLIVGLGFTPVGSSVFGARVETYLKAKSGAPLEIDGGLFVTRLLSRPTVGLSNIRLYETADWSQEDAPLLRSDRFEVRVAPQLPSAEHGLFRVSDVVFLRSELVVPVSNETGIDLSALRKSWTALTRSSPNYVELVDIGQIEFDDLDIVFVRNGNFEPIEVHVPKLIYDMDERAIAVHLVPDGETELVKIRFYEEGQSKEGALTFGVEGQVADLAFLGDGEIDEISPLRLRAQLHPEERRNGTDDSFSLRIAENQNGSYVSVFSGYVSGANVNGTLITPSVSQEAFSLKLKSAGEMDLGTVGSALSWRKWMRSGSGSEAFLPVDVTLDVEMEAVSIDDVRASPIRLVLHGDEEKTELVDFSIGLGEGTAAGSALMKWSDIPDLTVDLEASSLPLGDLGTLLNIDFQTTAKSIISAKLSSSGANAEEILTDLHGDLTVALFDGQFSGLSDNPITAHMIRSEADKNAEDIVQINCFVGAFDLIQGKAFSRLVYLDTDKSFASGSGMIDFDARTINMELRPRPKDPRLLADARDIFVTGLLDTPDFDFRTRRVARGFSSFSAGLASSTVTSETLSRLAQGASGAGQACIGDFLG